MPSSARITKIVTFISIFIIPCIFLQSQTNAKTPPAEESKDNTSGQVHTSVTVTESTDNNAEPAVLGEITCLQPQKVTGNIFQDENKNEIKEDTESGIQSVSIEIYSIEDGSRKHFDTLTTNSDGYWETDLCQGSYEVEIVSESLPKEIKLIGSQILSFEVTEDESSKDLNFAVEKEFKISNILMYLIPITVILIPIILIRLILKMRKKTAAPVPVPAATKQETLPQETTGQTQAPTAPTQV